MAIKVMRDSEMIEIEIENMKKGDVFALCDGSVKTCTSEPFFDDEENCYYVGSGKDLYHELLIADTEKEKNIDNTLKQEKVGPGEVLKNGNIELWARVGMSFEVPKEEYERLMISDFEKAGNLVTEWMEKGYGRANGDSYFTDGNDHEINFCMGGIPIVTSVNEKEKISDKSFDSLEKLVLLDECDYEGVGECIFEAFNEEDNDFRSMGKSLYLALDDCKENAEMKKGFEKAVLAITGYSMSTLIERLEETYSKELQDSMEEKSAGLDEKMKDAAGRASKGSEKGSERRADMEL